MNQGKIILVGGGTRSGKSRFALGLAQSLGPRRLFLASAQALPGDGEMRKRIALHQRERGADFVTVEEPWNVCDAIRRNPDFDVILFDCLTLWLSNLLLQDRSEAEILERLAELTRLLRNREQHAVIVTNEVGMGIVPETPLGRAFRDLAGLANQRLSECADEVYFALLGNTVRVKPACTCGSIGGTVS